MFLHPGQVAFFLSDMFTHIDGANRKLGYFHDSLSLFITVISNTWGVSTFVSIDRHYFCIVL